MERNLEVGDKLIAKTKLSWRNIFIGDVHKILKIKLNHYYLSNQTYNNSMRKNLLLESFIIVPKESCLNKEL